MENKNIIYTETQVNAMLQILNSLQIAGVDNCMRVAEIVRLLQSPVTDNEKSTNKDK